MSLIFIALALVTKDIANICNQSVVYSLIQIRALTRGAIQGTFTMAVVLKSVLNLLYHRKSPPGTIYYGKKSVRELFTTDSEFTLQVKTCSKGRNLLQWVYPVVNFFYG